MGAKYRLVRFICFQDFYLFSDFIESDSLIRNNVEIISKKNTYPVKKKKTLSSTFLIRLRFLNYAYSPFKPWFYVQSVQGRLGWNMYTSGLRIFQHTKVQSSQRERKNCEEGRKRVFNEKFKFVFFISRFLNICFNPKIPFFGH